jgi:hypothetical protein
MMTLKSPAATSAAALAGLMACTRNPMVVAATMKGSEFRVEQRVLVFGIRVHTVAMRRWADDGTFWYRAARSRADRPGQGTWRT